MATKRMRLSEHQNAALRLAAQGGGRLCEMRGGYWIPSGAEEAWRGRGPDARAAPYAKSLTVRALVDRGLLGYSHGPSSRFGSSFAALTPAGRDLLANGGGPRAGGDVGRLVRALTAEMEVPRVEGECETCDGFGHLRANGEGTVDRRERKCGTCRGSGRKEARTGQGAQGGSASGGKGR